MSLTKSLQDAITYAKQNGVDIPPDLYLKSYNVGIKSDSATNAAYRDTITQAMLDYFEGGNVTAPRNAFKRGIVDAFGAAADNGWQDGGQELPLDADALEWFNARVEAEFGHVDMLFAQIKELRKDKDFDFFSWVTQKADGYLATLKDIYNMAKLYASGNKMLTFAGEDGSEDAICQANNGTCVRLKGQRHRASWWLARDLVPYRGNPNYDCGAWNCQHYLEDDEGNKFTV